MFEFEPGLMIWTTVSFGIFVYLMYRFVLPPLLKVLKERERVIADSLSAARENQKRSEDLLASSNKKIAEASDIARKILDEARGEGERLKEGMLASSKRQSELFLAKAKEDLRREKDQMISEIKGKTADLIVEASSKVLGKYVDKTENRRIIEESIASWQQ
jgi:F-type H+-transporting ATPase subunit b